MDRSEERERLIEGDPVTPSPETIARLAAASPDLFPEAVARIQHAIRQCGAALDDSRINADSPAAAWLRTIKRTLSGDDPAWEVCSYCGGEFPAPVALHHSDEECVADHPPANTTADRCSSCDQPFDSPPCQITASGGSHTISGGFATNTTAERNPVISSRPTFALPAQATEGEQG